MVAGAQQPEDRGVVALGAAGVEHHLGLAAIEKRASVSRARSTALRARCPCIWIDDAFPNSSIQYGRIASITSGSRGVVAFASQ